MYKIPNILIGCPIYKRAWIAEFWLKAIEQQNFPLSNVGFIFELGPDDEETHDLLWQWHEKHPDLLVFDGTIQEHENHKAHPEGKRHWSQLRYLAMARFRNDLLDRATAMSNKFDYYFSLDSDILLKDKDSISRLVDYAEQFPRAVISPLSYMKPYPMDPKAHLCPSVMSWKQEPGGLADRDITNYPIGKPFFADIVMASVFMPKEVYTKVRYRGHRQGEDLGFAYQLNMRGFKSLAASDIYCPHIMHRSMLTDEVKSWFDETV